jgi:16S rRNA processing protein RimM
MENLTIIGYTQKPHGLNGEIKVFIEERYEEDFYACDTIFLNIKGKELPYFVDNVRGGNALIVKLEDVDNKEAALAIQGKPLSVRTADLVPESERETPTDPLLLLVGYTMQDENLGVVGIIETLEEVGLQQVFVVKKEEKEMLIPAVMQFIVNVDNNKQILHVNLPEGLVDL